MFNATRAGRLLGALGAIGLASAVLAQSGAARVPGDPCTGNNGSHVAKDGLHCGAVFDIPGHHTMEMPRGAAPPGCGRLGVIEGARASQDPGRGGRWNGGDWDYWTFNGEWVLWNGASESELGVLGQPINVRPTFHNWGPHNWAVRVFFRCGQDT